MSKIHYMYHFVSLLVIVQCFCMFLFVNNYGEMKRIPKVETYDSYLDLEPTLDGVIFTSKGIVNAFVALVCWGIFLFIAGLLEWLDNFIVMMLLFLGFIGIVVNIIIIKSRDDQS